MCKKLLVLTSFALTLVLWTGVKAQPTGDILIEYWNNMGGTVLESDLYNQARYPDDPDDYEMLTVFDKPYDPPYGDNYGARIRGFLYPPETGDYTFWIAADDDADLFLSTDADPANKVLIAEINGWCPAYDFDNTGGTDNPNQVSAPVTLEAGVKYYIEGVYKEGGGGDGMATAWQGPGITDRVIIDGAYLSPASLSLGLLRAGNPNPADGAVDVDTTALEWASGANAVSHKVYLSADETIDDADLAGETELNLHIAVLDDGATYYWRVDEIEADGTVREGAVWSFTTIPLEAHFPSPEDGARSQPMDAQLSWTPGKIVIMHDLYFGTDEAAIAARDMSTFKGKLMETSFDPGALDPETTYYWAVDEFAPPPTGTVAGPVWSFTTLGSVPITDPNLLLYYDFELGEGTVALDQSGHSNHGQFYGTPEWVDGAVSIVQDDFDYIETTGSLDIVSNTVSVTGWVYHDESPTAWSGILTHRGTSPGNIGLQHNGTELRYMWGADVYWDFSSGLEIPNGEWYFAAVTISPDQGKLYLNGIEQTATNVAPHEPSNFDGLIGVGRDLTFGQDRIMTSLIDEVRFYNKTLTDVEILALAKPNIVDVTGPGDVVKGVPDEARDGSVAGWPDNEHPALAVDDDTSTKFLHFRGEVSPTGFVVEPAMGPTIVTGLTLTTANDAVERDPASYEISGSNESIDGPYELIASGELVDFIQETAWPRFTKNATAISFKNESAYRYYQVMFPTVRDAGSANSMQIGEVELLGVPISDVTSPGDVIQGVPNDGDWPGAEHPALAFDNDSGTKYLHRKGGSMATGVQVEPAVGPTIVMGLTLTTANDDYGRDPISFELSGSNEGIDGPYELIAAGDVVDFAQEELWPRFTKNATPMLFNNSAVYAYYQIVFPTLRDPASPLMQIAEVELLGIPAPGPVAHWTLDDGAGAVALDSSGNAIDGAVVGEPLWVGGKRDGALELDGVDDYVDCGNPAALDFGTGDFTVAAWIKLTTVERATIYAKGGDNSGGIRYTLAMGESNDNKMTLTTDDNSTKAQARGDTVVNDGAWHHVVGMRSGNMSYVYVDGVLDGSIDLPEGYDLSGTSQANALLGAITDAQDPTGATLEKFFTGQLDDVRVYNRALTGPEIAALAVKGNIIWVDGDYDDTGDGAVDDLEWVDILTAEGYAVDNSESYIDLDDAKIAALNAADLVIVSRNSNSGDYDDGDEIAQWNAITTPIIMSSTHIIRSSRWKWVDSTSILSLTPATVVLADGTEIPGINADVGPASFIDAAAGNGTILATGDGLPFIIEWEAGVEFYAGAGEIAGGPRVFFTAGTQEGTDAAGEAVGRGEMNLMPEALDVFIDMVDSMIE